MSTPPHEPTRPSRLLLPPDWQAAHPRAELPGRPHLPPGWLTPAGVATVLAALALVLYGVMRVSTATFYADFGLRPEDLKLGYPGLLEQSLGFFGLTVAVTFSLLVAVAGVAIVSVDLLEKAGPSRWQRWLLLGCSLVAVGLFVLVLYATRQGAVFIGVSVALAAVMNLAYAALWVRRSLPMAALCAVIAIGVVVVGLMLGLVGYARDSAAQARRGKAVESLVFGVPSVPWHVSTATVIASEQLPAAGLARIEQRCCSCWAQAAREPWCTPSSKTARVAGSGAP